VEVRESESWANGEMRRIMKVRNDFLAGSLMPDTEAEGTVSVLPPCPD